MGAMAASDRADARSELPHAGKTVMGEEFSSKLLCPRPDNRISAAVVNAEQASLEKEVIEPFGLGGWSWGVLRLHDVAIDPATELIGRAGDGIGVFRRHFAQFRPLVTATALGTAAGVHTLVAETLAARTRVGMLPKVGDHALVIIGRTHAGDHRGYTVDHYHSPVCGAPPESAPPPLDSTEAA